MSSYVPLTELRPCPISSSVGWMGIQENTWALEGLQSLYVPAQIVPQKKAGGMTLRKRKAAANNNANATQALAATADDEPEKPRKRVRTTRASQRAKAALAATPAPVEDADEEQASSSSLLFSSGAAAAATGIADSEALAGTSGASALDGAVAVTRDVKQEFIATTPVLQAIGLMLELPSVAACDLLPPAVISASPPSPSPSPSSSATASVNDSPVAPARRSMRARRKPAPPGPCSLVSTPLSALDTPLPSADAVLPLPETPESVSEPGNNSKRNRSGSRGSSTAVSEGGYPSEEGTVVDAEIEAHDSSPCKGKRKAVEIESEVADFERDGEQAQEDEQEDEEEPEEQEGARAKTSNAKGRSRKAPAAKKRRVSAAGGGKRRASRKA